MEDSKKRESWGSRFGFIMATAGFAIGLGNVWRFPYMVGENGGGAFLLTYVLICAVICVPLFIEEVSLGRKMQLNPVSGMRKATKKGSPWVLIGWFGSIAALLIMSYYLMIIGWIFAYLFKVALGTFNGASAAEISNIFDTLVSSPIEVFMYTIPPAIILGLIVTRGLKDGVEKACKIMMPTLFIMLIILAIRSITLPGAWEGIQWYFTPDFSKINSSTILAALGQAFFSVGIGMAAAFMYGSYLKPKESDIPKDGILVILFDMLIAIIAGLVIFPALFAFKMMPDAGPGLIFLTMPKLFAQLPGGNFFGAIFFFLLILASFSTGVGFIEALASTTSELCNIKRKKAVWVTIGVMLILGIPSILSQGPWAHVLIFGKNIFDLVDYISGNVLLTSGALLLSLYTAFVWKFENFMEDTNMGASNFKISKSWKVLVCYVIPVVVTIILITGLV
ncbi:MAG: sodium-dependent transporter [Clostridiales bacterium]|nr:sodium-dependent transporter [Clostridiales bacterium]MCF8021304.1 sodium-dependent transporter [Clostridiales bacterium]